MQSLSNFTVFPEAFNHNHTKLIIPCGYFSTGGKYYVLARKKNFEDFYGDLGENENGETSIVTETIDVQWSMPKLRVLPDHIQTYPKDPVVVTLDFPESCPPASESLGTTTPEFWFELFYCGVSPTSCDGSARRNQSYQVSFIESFSNAKCHSNFIVQNFISLIHIYDLPESIASLYTNQTNCSEDAEHLKKFEHVSDHPWAITKCALALSSCTKVLK